MADERPNPDHNVYILGAGASRDAGLPVIANFMNRLRDSRPWLESAQRADEVNAVDEVMRFRKSSATAAERISVDLENIEDVFSLAAATNNADLLGQLQLAMAATLDFARQTCSPRRVPVKLPFVPDASLGPHPVGKDEQQRPTSWRCSVPVPLLYAGIMSGALCSSFATMESTVITFNYDTSLEEYLSLLGVRYTYEIPTEFMSGNFLPRGAREPKGGPLRILKLHGSVNWAPLPSPNSSRLSIRDSYAEIRKLGATPLLIPPTWRKPIPESLLAVWDHAVNALRRATRIIIVGYSVPTTDSFFRFLLGAGGINDTSSLRRVIFVNPAAKKLERRLRRVFRSDVLTRPIFTNTVATCEQLFCSRSNLEAIKRPWHPTVECSAVDQSIPGFPFLRRET